MWRALVGVCWWACVGGRVLVGVCWWACVGGRVLVGVCWWACVGGRVLVGVCWWTCIRGSLMVCAGAGFLSHSLLFPVVKLTKALTRTVNKGEKNMLDTKYFEDLVFDQISSVEETYPFFFSPFFLVLLSSPFLTRHTYPAYALRTIYLSSWCTAEDKLALQSIVGSAVEIAKSDKSKKIIQKR
jgi:hypothetical protein